MAAVERIEFLQDGASAVYGSDAVAGVVNIITKKDFEGVDINARYGANLAEADGDETSFQLVAGTRSGKTSILTTFDYFKRDAIMAPDREMGGSAYIPGKPGGDGRSPYGIPGFAVLTTRPGTLSPTLDALNGQTIRNTEVEYADAAGLRSVYLSWADCPEVDQANDGTCLYDFAQVYQIQPQSDRQSFMSLIEHELTEDATLYGQVRYARAYTKTSNAPSPGIVTATQSPFAADFIRNNLFPNDAAVANALVDELNAGDLILQVGRRYLDFPNREKDNTNTTAEAVVGIKGVIGSDYDYDVSWGHSKLTNTQIGSAGQLLSSSLSEAFAKGWLNPFAKNDCSSTAPAGDSGKSVAQLCKDLQAATFRESTFEISFANAGISGDLGVELEGGVIGFAAGVDWRREGYNDRSDPASIARQVIGGAGSLGGGYATNQAAYVETLFPVLDNLDITAALRHDKADWGISDDAQTTYGLSFAFRPADGLLLRGSMGSGFKAPALDQLYLASSFGVTPAIDRKACNEAGNDPDAAACKTTQLRSLGGGNTMLTAETSKNYNIGVAYEVFDGLSFSLDMWSLKIEDIIGSLGIQEILDAEAQGNLTQLVNRVDGRLADPDSYVRTQLENLNEGSAKGLILDVKYGTDLSFGRFSSAFNLDYTLSRKSQLSAVQPLCEQTDSDATRRYRANLDLQLDTGDLSTGFNVRYVPGYNAYQARDTANKSCDLVGYFGVTRDANGYTNFGTPQKVSSYVQVDFRAAYDLTASQTVSVGVRNLFDRNPPFEDPNNWPFYSQANFDNIGRFVYVGYNVSF